MLVTSEAVAVRCGEAAVCSLLTSGLVAYATEVVYGLTVRASTAVFFFHEWVGRGEGFVVADHPFA
jgi:hypothetical protein